MKIYKYIKPLEPDPYYGGPDEEILFYCNDENKDNKIKEHLKTIIDKKRFCDYKHFIYKKKSYNVRVFYDFNKDILGLISDLNEYFILENALILNESNNDLKYFITACHKGHHQFYLGESNKKNYSYKSLKISKEEFNTYNLSECEYSILKKEFNEFYIVSTTALDSKLYCGNYNLFEKEFSKLLTYNEYKKQIKDIEKDYKLIEIKYK